MRRRRVGAVSVWGPQAENPATPSRPGAQRPVRREAMALIVVSCVRAQAKVVLTVSCSGRTASWRPFEHCIDRAASLENTNKGERGEASRALLRGRVSVV